MLIKGNGDYIDGRFVRRRGQTATLVSVDAGDRECLIGEYPSYQNAADQALHAAHKAWPAWAEQQPGRRLAGLRRLKAQLRNQKEDLARLLSREVGRPLWDARAEVRTMLEEVDGFLRQGATGSTDNHTVGGNAQQQLRPIGVAAVITPYPQPALLMHADVVAAIAAGCTVVCKPSPRTPAVAQLYAEIVHEADLPRGVFNMIQGDADHGQALALHALTDVVLFSGTTATATSLTSELAIGSPGKPMRALVTAAPAALVLDDANLDQAAYQIVLGCCVSAGQRCDCTRRVLVHRRVAASLRQRLVALLSGVHVGYPEDSDVFMGPLIDAQIQQRYLAQVEHLARGDGQMLIVGEPLTVGRSGAYVTPSLLQVEARRLTDMCQEELVGPCLGVAEIESLEEGAEVINGCDAGLSNAVFAGSDDLLRAVAQRLRGGLVLFNAATTSRPGGLPLETHGVRRGSAPYGLLTSRFCSRAMMVVRHGSAHDATMLPPGLPGLS